MPVEEWKVVGFDMRQWAILLAWYRKTHGQPDLKSTEGILDCAYRWKKIYSHNPGEVIFAGVEADADWPSARDAMLNFTNYVYRCVTGCINRCTVVASRHVAKLVAR